MDEDAEVELEVLHQDIYNLVKINKCNNKPKASLFIDEVELGDCLHLYHLL
jgi:hypothetical protein